MNFRRRFSATPLIFLLLLIGCTKPEEQNEFSPGLNKTNRSDRPSVRREPEDPYAIHNILKAYSSLKAAEPSTPSIEITPNHVYLRFLPQDDSEANLLQSDTTLILFDQPLDHEIPGYETAHDTKVSPYSWQYCVVPAGMVLPQVHHELIYEVFIPPDKEYSAKSNSDGLTVFFDALIDESMRLTGNLTGDDTAFYQESRSSRDRWTPKGRIRVWDDLLCQFIPLQHANVHARWFTRIETALTDEDGYFHTSSFRHKVHYSIKWENSLFTIRNGSFLQAWFNGPHQKGDWNLDIKGGKSEMFATIHRAAYKSFYGENLGLGRPTLRFGGRTKICYMDDNGTGIFLGDWSAGGLLPDIKIWGNDGNRATNNIFATVTHELGHQSHSQFVGNIKYIKTEKIIRESWAEAIEWSLTNDEYNKLGKKYGSFKAANYNHQAEKHNKWPFVSDISYSPIFIDLVDVINQRLANGPAHPNDLISEYSLAYINRNLLVNATDIVSLKAEVTKHRLEGVDDYQIDELFRLY